MIFAPPITTNTCVFVKHAAYGEYDVVLTDDAAGREQPTSAGLTSSTFHATRFGSHVISNPCCDITVPTAKRPTDATTTARQTIYKICARSRDRKISHHHHHHHCKKKQVRHTNTRRPTIRGKNEARKDQKTNLPILRLFVKPIKIQMVQSTHVYNEIVPQKSSPATPTHRQTTISAKDTRCTNNNTTHNQQQP